MQSEEIDKILKKTNELVFLTNPDSPHLKLIILFHSMNLCSNCVCTGLLEDDPFENYIIPPNWDKHIDNIYSFRYSNTNNKQENLYFKIIHEPLADMMFINVVSSNKPDIIISDEVLNISKYTSFDNKELICKLIKTYQVKILAEIFKKQEKPIEKNNKNEIPRPNDFFWNRPRNVEQPPFMPTFGDYGSSDLRPLPLGGINSGGSILGPNNPIFSGYPNQNNNPNPLNNPGPNIRFDPFGPDGINGSFSGYDEMRPKDPRFGFGGSGIGPGGGSNNNFFF